MPAPRLQGIYEPADAPATYGMRATTVAAGVLDAAGRTTFPNDWSQVAGSEGREGRREVTATDQVFARPVAIRECRSDKSSSDPVLQQPPHASHGRIGVSLIDPSATFRRQQEIACFVLNQARNPSGLTGWPVQRIFGQRHFLIRQQPCAVDRSNRRECRQWLRPSWRQAKISDVVTGLCLARCLRRAARKSSPFASRWIRVTRAIGSGPQHMIRFSPALTSANSADRRVLAPPIFTRRVITSRSSDAVAIHADRSPLCMFHMFHEHPPRLVSCLVNRVDHRLSKYLYVA